MGQFLYFKANATDADVSRKALQSSPLALPLRDLLRSPKLFEERVAVNTVHNNGPGGNAGQLVMVGDESLDNPQLPVFRADCQQWKPMGESGWMIGVDELHRPTEVSLRRERGEMIGGYELVLGDGAGWTAPTVRAWDSGLSRAILRLPSRWTLGENGEPQTVVREEYRELWDETSRFMDLWASSKAYDPADGLRFAAKCLSLNYRVGLYELLMLDLLDVSAADKVCGAALDLPLIEQILVEKSASPKEDAPAPD